MDVLDALHLCGTHYGGNEKDMLKDITRISKLVKTFDAKTLDMMEFVSRLGQTKARKIIKEAHHESTEPKIKLIEGEIEIDPVKITNNIKYKKKPKK